MKGNYYFETECKITTQGNDIKCKEKQDGNIKREIFSRMERERTRKSY